MEKKDNEITPEQIQSMVENGSPLTDEMIEVLESGKIRELIRKYIPAIVIEQAKRMNVNLEEHFLTLILSKEDTTSVREILISKVAGIVGNAWANKYFQEEGYLVENEVPILNDKGKATTASDIVLTSQDGKRTFIELKTIKALISDVNDYPEQPIVEGQFIPREKYIDLKRGTLQQIAVFTGKKAPEQLRKTREYVDRLPDKADISVSLCVFKGATISPDIRERVEQYGGIIELPLEVDKIFEYSNMLVDVLMYKGRNILYPPRGETERDVSIPDIDL